MQFPYVLFQVKVPAEAFPAGPASEGLLVVVRVHVKREVIDLMEGFATDWTLVLFFATVGQFVILVIPCKINKKKKKNELCQIFPQQVNSSQLSYI